VKERCRDVQSKSTVFVDGAAVPMDRRRVADHLEDCPECNRFVTAEQRARSLVQSHADTLAECAPSRLLRKCTTALRRAGIHLSPSARGKAESD
jgi:anti-sigma factor RsiW